MAYGRIYILGSVFVLLVMGMNPFITTQGFAKISMLTTVIGAVINIILDPILIFGLGWGVRGAAVATVLSQAVGACWILKFLTGPKTIPQAAERKPQSGAEHHPAGAGAGHLVLRHAFDGEFALHQFQLQPRPLRRRCGCGRDDRHHQRVPALHHAYSGYLSGRPAGDELQLRRRQKPRVKEAFRFQLTLCFGYTTLFWLLMMLVPGVVAGIFTSDAALIEYTTWAMRIYMAGILAMGVQIACQQSFMALGQAKVSLLLACLRKIILLIPLIFILPCFTADKCLGVFLAEPVSDILAATITAITFFSRFDKILDKGAGKV